MSVELEEMLRDKVRAYYERQGDETGMHFAATLTLPELLDYVLKNLSDSDAMCASAGADAERAIRLARQAEDALAEAKRPFTEQMERQNRTIIELNARLAAMGGA
jgi:inactivated superfamily I helicase